MPDTDAPMKQLAKSVQSQAEAKLTLTVEEIAYDEQKIYVVLDGPVQQSRNEFRHTLWNSIKADYPSYILEFMDASEAADQPVQTDDGIAYRFKIVEKEPNPLE